MLIPFTNKHLPGTAPVKCRHCGSEDVRLSRRTKVDSKRYVYRCRACGQQFRSGVNFAARLPTIIMFLVILTLVVGLSLAYYITDSHSETKPVSVTSSTDKTRSPGH
jgi:DNA-directed RNA polymerase subunit RPC12/RpoP